MTDLLAAACDLLLLLGATLRVVRLIVADDFPGTWLIRGPVNRWAYDHKRYVMHDEDVTISSLGWRGKLAQGLECPYCVGFWIGVAALGSLWLVGGPGHAPEWWRYLTGAFALNYVVGFIVSRLDGGDE